MSTSAPAAQTASETNPLAKTSRIAVTGASGMVGRHLTDSLNSSGAETLSLVRRSQIEDVNEIAWDPATGVVNGAKLEGLTAVVHLAGENIASSRWNDQKKQRIKQSRVEPTRRLCEQLAALAEPPKVLVCASATGFYGDRGSAELDEGSKPGSGFLPEVCREWEDATQPARAAGIRVVNVRIGVVLSSRGGALQKMLMPFKLGAGGNVGNGRQHWSWITLDDLVGVIEFCISNESLSGPVNAVAPEASTNAEFTKALGRVLHRPTLIPMPGFLARIALGEMANDLLLASTRVVPRKLLKAGYEFQQATLDAALQHAVRDQD